jgi:hypothetical protein
LGKELEKLAGAHSTKGALRKFGLLGAEEDDFELISAPEGWYRSGAETYLYRFRVRKEGVETPLVLKACVAYSPPTTLEAILHNWMERRELLSSRGVLTPKLYAWGYGEVLEEDVLFDLDGLLQKPDPPSDSLLLAMADVAGVIASLGFLPIGLFGDLRSHGEDVVVVDFGQDLGPPSVAKDDNPQIFDQLLEHLSKKGALVSETLRQRMRSVFDAQRHLKLQ